MSPAPGSTDPQPAARGPRPAGTRDTVGHPDRFASDDRECGGPPARRARRSRWAPGPATDHGPREDASLSVIGRGPFRPERVARIRCEARDTAGKRLSTPLQPPRRRSAGADGSRAPALRGERPCRRRRSLAPGAGRRRGAGPVAVARRARRGGGRATVSPGDSRRRRSPTSTGAPWPLGASRSTPKTSPRGTARPPAPRRCGTCGGRWRRGAPTPGRRGGSSATSPCSTAGRGPRRHHRLALPPSSTPSGGPGTGSGAASPPE